MVSRIFYYTLTLFIFSIPLFCDQQKTLIYSTNPYYPPYDWVINDTAFDGASVELLEMVIPPNVTLKPAVFPWKRSQSMAEDGSIDLLISLRITPERSKFLNFTTHRAFPNPIVVFVRKDRAFKFTGREDLKGKKGGISLGDTFGGGFDEYWKKELSIEQAANMEDNFQKLEQGRIDYFVSGQFLGEAYTQSRKLDYPIISLSPPISSFDIYFGFSKNYKDQEVINYINKKLEEVDKKGIPEKLLKKYLDKYIANPVDYKLK